ncbi:YbaK / prolyl-tRNA synthetases associated domain containing protein, putative [Eimeria tenella]|uniref:YbaK / prolyl-tRNA synthetases associated domain containing protein, putative n=1 Tax=Eimeria tenella TaxID=5802 RepID=U6KVD6_EIMTE|nr:YbaK / prolyl-tRNA synthetases associated domain containing protein, putative [Eimeria tenella]CDJ39450.1 YbaK / prolyl-tRNA synthetases associated domain containing protein, putative [Eimeria tenella]|eukprot:XP_013230205.1 YbaK / prolyl-tRNA synthetases associated domain containing protein, putative [Eimeria tenella]
MTTESSSGAPGGPQGPLEGLLGGPQGHLKGGPPPPGSSEGAPGGPPEGPPAAEAATQGAPQGPPEEPFRGPPEEASSEGVPHQGTPTQGGPPQGAPGGPPSPSGPPEGPPEGPPSVEDEMEHSAEQERRMRSLFAADAAALAADPAAAAAAAAAAAEVVAAGASEEAARAAAAAAAAATAAAAGHVCEFRLFRINKEIYYVSNLEERLPLLGAKTINQLCKTIVVENTKHTGPEDRLNSRFYLVVLQSKDKLNGERVKDLIKAENAKVGRQLGNKRLNFNFCSSFEGLTGFKRNGVGPLGSKKEIPVILSKPLLSLFPLSLFLGGGAPDLKLQIGLLDLIRITNPIIGVVC